ncbi:hypothetical protein ISO99_02810 [Staphylococcus sp. 18_1_E_LY]|uniref:Uncharacterized protein n=1 Tax=Staphylococcus lloydii TaxID=2781774 RepID=A0A7T1AYH4_9STAP|nr:hypothetical protein [Staphylococcus lloydii]MBF7018832.1 hypothetical protein [Staphylococcus lloydii]MBF7026560.1 hypothetical protein [Staphylococcus lloydii]MDU9417550.1 hypothetical protein [Staphylococcus lloydii]QPM74226.1 hypothetical protein ISP08_07670 [Staphylococcus lloydii]
MSINIDPESFANLVVSANPSKSDDAEEVAKESLELYINAYRLAERYSNISTNSYDTAEIIQEVKNTDLELT